MSASVSVSSPTPTQVSAPAPSPSPISKSFARLRKKLMSRATLRALISLVVFVLLWEAGSRSKQWLGFSLPSVPRLPNQAVEVRLTRGGCDAAINNEVVPGDV